MRITINIQNNTTGEQVFTATAPDIDSAISELGRIERMMKDGYECILCGEPINNEHGYCDSTCCQKHNVEIEEHAYKDNLHI